MIDNKLLYALYGLTAEAIEKTAIGAGSDTYFVTCKNGKYVFKFPCESEMNNPDGEPQLCEFLRAKGLKVSEFIRNIDGEFISVDKTGRKFHVQKFIEGITYDLNAAPPWLFRESAALLGQIHTALLFYKGLPAGLSKNFFASMTPKHAQQSYKNTLCMAKQRADKKIELDLTYRIALMERLPNFELGLDKLTFCGSHGDYFISQFICGNAGINAVIDWTTACVHPVVWEIIRSYVYASPKCRDGTLDIGEFLDYVAAYLLYAPLNNQDLASMAKLFYYQIAVCDYYGQYYQSAADNRDIYLHQAVFSTKLMRWFEHNVEALSNALLSRFAT